MATGLLLGAGASYEAGMPLVWGLTTELKRWLTPDKLHNLNAGWREQGGGVSSAAIDTLTSALQTSDMHYEAILGSLELFSVRNPSQRQDVSFLNAKMLEIIYYMLYVRHVGNADYPIAGLRYIEGIAGLARAEKPLWVFSLNHDLIIEMLAAQYGLICDGGFSGDTYLPERNARGEKIGDLKFETLSAGAFLRNGMHFARSGDINIIKIHGSIDVFMTNDGADFYKISCRGQDARSVVDNLRSANEKLLSFVDGRPLGRARPINEIAFSDENGDTQFLQKTLLSGSRKFDPRSHQVLPRGVLQQFSLYIERLSNLIVIGYSFGDIHVNDIIKKWAEDGTTRRMTIVGPGVTSCPAFLTHVRSQVDLVDGEACDYLEQFAMTPLTNFERATKVMRYQMRRHLGI